MPDQVRFVQDKAELKKVIDINNDQIAFQYLQSIKIFSVKYARQLHKVKFDWPNTFIRQCLRLNFNLLIIRERSPTYEVRISFWHIWQRKFVYLWDDFPGARRFSRIELGVSNFGNDDKFFLADNENIYIVRLVQVEGDKLQLKIDNKLQIHGWDDINDKKVYTVSACHSKIAIKTSSRIILFDVSTGSILFQFSSGHLSENSLTDKYLVYYDLETLQIVVRDAQSSQVISKSVNLEEQTYCRSQISNAIPFHNVRFAIQGSVLTTRLTYREHRASYWDIFIVSSLETYEVFLKYSSQGKVLRKFIPRLIQYGLVVPVKKYTSLVSMSKTITDAAFENQQTEIELPYENPLTRAYIDCLQQPDASPLQFCNELITYNRCKQSFKEYFYAHRLLMLAIQEETIDRGPNHDGEYLKWFDSLYHAGRELHLTSQTERNALKTLLAEAEQVGVIRDAALVLSAHDMTTEYRAQNSTILDLGKELLNRLVHLEDGHSSLVDAFERYKQVQNVTQLVGVALNVIPFVGGSIAAAISAGAEVLEGLAVGDLVGFGLETQNEVIMGSQTMENLLLRYTGDQLERDKLNGMDLEARENLSTHLSSCGVTPEVLRILFRNGAEQRFIHPSQVRLTTCLSPTGKTDVRDKGKARVIVDGLYDSITDPHEDAPKKDSELFEDTSTNSTKMKTNSCETPSNDEHVHRGKHWADVSDGRPSRHLDFSIWSLEELEDFEITKANVRCLKRKNASVLMAAYICGYEPDEFARFETLKDVLYKLFSISNINGLVISNRTVVPTSSLTDIIVQYIRKTHKELCEDVLLNGRVNAFIEEASQ